MVIITAMTVMMTATLTVKEMLKLFIISFVRTIVFKILARATLLVKADLLKKVNGACVWLDLRILIVEQVDKKRILCFS